MLRSIILSLGSSAALILLSISPLRTYAQDAPSSGIYRFSVGPFFSFVADVFAGEVPYTWKTGMKFANSFGVMSVFRTSSRFAITMDAGYDSRELYFRNEDNEDINTTYGIGSLDIGLGVKFSDFMLGFGFGFPVSTSMETKTPLGTVKGTDAHFAPDSLAMKIELRIGAAFDLVESDVGRLQFIIKGAYPLTAAFKDKHPMQTNNGSSIITQPTTVNGNSTMVEDGNAATLQIGFSYIFNLGQKD